MASPSEQLALNPKRCSHCGLCVPACPHGAVKVGRAYIRVDAARCDGCGACAQVCAPGAIKRAGASRRAAPGAGARPAARPRTHVALPAETPRARSASAAPPVGAPQPRARVRGAAAPFTWTLTEAAAMLAVTLAAFMVRELALASDVVQSLPGDTLVLARTGLLAVYYAVQIAVLWRLISRRGGVFGDALGLRVDDSDHSAVLGSAGLVVGALVVTRVLATLYGVLTRELGTTPDISAVTRTFGTSTLGLALAALMLVVVGPFVEECVFRGALLRGLEPRIGAWPAIVAQSLLFAAFHRSWWLLVPITILGLALGWLAHERRSLWPAIALHASYNALTFAAVVWVSR